MNYLPFVITIALTTPANANSNEKIPITDFQIDQTEVTVAQFREFAQATNFQTKAEQDGGGYEWGAGWEQRPDWNYLSPYGEPAADDEPAAHITFSEAQRYCQWAGGQLPSAEQWALAAYTETRSAPPAPFEKGKTYLYSSGDSAKSLNADHDLDDYTRHAPVKALPAGVNDLYQMGGNLWEWGADKQGEQYITLGSSWWYGAEKSKRSGFQYKPDNFAAVYIGFRCVYPIEK